MAIALVNLVALDGDAFDLALRADGCRQKPPSENITSCPSVCPGPARRARSSVIPVEYATRLTSAIATWSFRASSSRSGTANPISFPGGSSHGRAAD